ncbi:ABC transporter-like protein [Sesbania bispinosa]|nr:ABC transporter-like protein [Sesbania bispinosa]
MRIRAIKEESALVERVNDVEWSGNGVAAANGRNDSGNGVVEGYVNGTTNGSMVKYDYGNGVAAEVVEVEASKLNEDGRKRRLEEIGKEDAWFKQTGKERVEVAVAPGGR